MLMTLLMNASALLLLLLEALAMIGLMTLGYMSGRIIKKILDWIESW